MLASNCVAEQQAACLPRTWHVGTWPSWIIIVDSECWVSPFPPYSSLIGLFSSSSSISGSAGEGRLHPSAPVLGHLWLETHLCVADPCHQDQQVNNQLQWSSAKISTASCWQLWLWQQVQGYLSVLISAEGVNAQQPDFLSPVATTHGFTSA